MKVILFKDVPKVGQQFEVKEVTDGFARNFLIPRGLATAADQSTLTKLEKWRQEGARRKEKQTQEATEIIKKLAGLKVILEVKAGESGRLFAAVSLKEIRAILKSQVQIILPDKSLHLEKPIKSIGEHKISVQIGDLSGDFILEVKPIKFK